MTRAAIALLLLLAACGKPKPPPDPLDTPSYQAWKQEQILRRLPMAAGGLRVPGHIDVYAPEQRSKNPGDFVEMFMNGERIGKYNVAKLPDGTWPRIAFDVDFNSGPNTFDLWDSSSNKYYRQQVDTRYITGFLCLPTADGYEIQEVKKKE
ncbi:MAG: hypothetical protein JO332_18340 [Planctomycetaceae bacterium]|nr:hypothetical protein [Planctomycetaceae bacterium]